MASKLFEAWLWNTAGGEMDTDLGGRGLVQWRSGFLYAWPAEIPMGEYGMIWGVP